MPVKHILGFITLLFFLVFLIVRNEPRRSYLLFLLYFFPFIDLNVTHENYGSITIFDALSYFMLLFLIKDFLVSAYNRLYPVLFTAFIIFLLFGCIKSQYVVNSLFSLIKFAAAFIYAKLLVDECLSDPAFKEKVVNALKFSCFLSIAFFLVQLKAGLGFTFYNDLNQNVFDSNTERYPSYFQDPQIFAVFLSMMAFLFLTESKNSRRFTSYLSFMAVILTLFFSGGRSAFLGLCAGIVLVFLFWKVQFRLFITGLAGLALVALSYYTIPISLFNRKESYSDAMLVRTKIWNEAYDVFLKHPFVGIGTGNYQNYISTHSQDGYYLINNQVVYYGTESGYLKILTETGIPGFVFFALFITVPLFSAFKHSNRTNKNWPLLVAPLLSWLASFSTLNTLSDKRIVILVASLLALLVVPDQKMRLSHVPFKN